MFLEFQFFKENGVQVLKIYTYWQKHVILNGMSDYYYSDDWEEVKNYIDGGEETIIEAYHKIKNLNFKNKVKKELSKIGFKLNMD